MPTGRGYERISPNHSSLLGITHSNSSSNITTGFIWSVGMRISSMLIRFRIVVWPLSCEGRQHSLFEQWSKCRKLLLWYGRSSNVSSAGVAKVFFTPVMHRQASLCSYTVFSCTTQPLIGTTRHPWQSIGRASTSFHQNIFEKFIQNLCLYLFKDELC